MFVVPNRGIVDIRKIQAQTNRPVKAREVEAGSGIGIVPGGAFADL